MTGKRVAVFLTDLGMGGAERVMVTVANAIVRRGHAVEFVLSRKSGILLDDVGPGIEIVEIDPAPHLAALPGLYRLAGDRLPSMASAALGKLPLAVRSLSGLSAYLAHRRPEALLTTIAKNNIVAIAAARRSGASTRVVIREANTMSQDITDARKRFDRLVPGLVRHWYPKAQEIVAVSNGVADDLSAFAGIDRGRITAIPNPVDVDRIRARAAEEPGDDWFTPGRPPVLLAVGRLEPQKDYPTLLQSFAEIRARRDVRLVILGEGTQRGALEALVDSLGLADSVRIPGATKNPYAFMARASALVLSSRWEGFPNVLTEALACGCPVVSTRCPSGPDEILDNGRYGRLVAVGDHKALAEAVLETLDAPPPASDLQRRADRYSLDRIVNEYLDLLTGVR